VVVLPEVGFEAAATAGQKIFDLVNDATKEYPPISVSIGVAWFEGPDRPFESLLQDADELMYTVKIGGRNNLSVKRYP
jgi:diguanylate cyclase (GGDEF)-like protein